jgi:hypothetical protein
MRKQNIKKETLLTASVVVSVLILFAAVLSYSQSNTAQSMPLTIQCSTQGTNTQSGSLTSIVIRINEYTTEQERNSLAEVFLKSGSQGLSQALKKMPTIGRISLSGTPGYDLKFIRLVPGSPAGTRKIRIVTDRPIAVAEAWKASTRTMDYSLSALEVELDMSNVKDNSKGILLPACQFIIDKKTRELNIENYQNPWKLFNFFGLKEGK